MSPEPDVLLLEPGQRGVHPTPSHVGHDGLTDQVGEARRKAERDMATSAASDATLQGCAGSRWMRAMARPIWRSWSVPSHPVCAAGSCSRWDRVNRASPGPRLAPA